MASNLNPSISKQTRCGYKALANPFNLPSLCLPQCRGPTIPLKLIADSMDGQVVDFEPESLLVGDAGLAFFCVQKNDDELISGRPFNT